MELVFSREEMELVLRLFDRVEGEPSTSFLYMVFGDDAKKILKNVRVFIEEHWSILGVVMDWKEIKKWQEFADRYVVIERQLGGPPNYMHPSILRYVPTRTTDRTEIEKC